MSDVVISVENLSKRYFVGHNTAPAERYTALRDVLGRNARNLARKTRDMLAGRAIVQGDEVEEFWALKDVSFEVRQGDVLGIIGRNGAGKSTLLKILSRITEPTKGRVRVSGRVASLLEVGTGFHPELSGRENIYLNGAILGMQRAEIARQFDEIVAFAGVERFVDTPVKRYSSGMYVRLAFSIAAHLQPDVLIIDEVLAVGDAEFQKKCLGKMREVGKQGRTVLFVSHNLSAVKNLCTTGLLLDAGIVIGAGSSREVVDHYFNEGEHLGAEGSVTWPADRRPGNDVLRLQSVSVALDSSTSGDPPEKNIVFECTLISTSTLKDIDIGFNAFDSNGVEVLHTASCTQVSARSLSQGSTKVQYKLPAHLLRAGVYSLTVSAALPYRQLFFREQDVLSFRIVGESMIAAEYPDDTWGGVLSPRLGSWAGLQGNTIAIPRTNQSSTDEPVPVFSDTRNHASF